jgi:4-hydroxybenzoate polyprenyltransferase
MPSPHLRPPARDALPPSVPGAQQQSFMEVSSLAQSALKSDRRGVIQFRSHERALPALDERDLAAELLAPEHEAEVSPGRPLVVDIDGTLVRSDLLIETVFCELGKRPQALLGMCRVLATGGKAALKHHAAEAAKFDPAALPYDDAVMARIRDAQAEGRPVYLASAASRPQVEAIARHLGVFNGWFASEGRVNLSGDVKAARLVEAFGEGGFDYIGNDAADLAVWAQAGKALAIRAPAGVSRRLAQTVPEVEYLPHPRPDWRTWAKLIRVHQYAKNALVFLPLLTAHLFEPEAFLKACLAAIAFSLCASSVYVLNDLVDLADDRRHRTKRDRPLASGAIPLMHGLVAVPLLFAAAVAVAAAVSWAFVAALLAYFALTTAYSFGLKRMMLVDVITLAMLYAVRVIGGAVALDVVVSKWLLGFCLFLFMSLALIKRYVELAARLDAKLPDPANRDYRVGDLDVVTALAAASGFNAVTVFALYVSSDTVRTLYHRPEILWLVCPILMYWVGRALMLAHRRQMDDDPVVFALKDRVSLATIAIAGALFTAAL